MPLRVIGVFKRFRAPNTSVLVFSMFTVSLLSSQKRSRRSISRCNPLCVVDISTRSSAYNKRGTTSPANDGASAPGTSLSSPSNPSKNIPNRLGLNGHPCLTPIVQGNGCVSPFAVLTHALSILYMLCSAVSMRGPTPAFLRTSHRITRGTVSKAFLKSTKHVYSFGVLRRECVLEVWCL